MKDEPWRGDAAARCRHLEGRLANKREELRRRDARITDLEEKARRYYKPSGAYILLDSPEAVVERRKADAARIAELERERDEARAETARTLTYWRGAWHGAHEEGLEFRARAEAAEAEVARLRQALAYVEENVLCSGCLEQDAYEQVRDFMEGTRDAFYDPVLEREARLREALEWFADRDNYDLGASETYTVHGFVDRARRALQQQPQAQEEADRA